MRVLVIFLLVFCYIDQSFSRSHGVRRNNICDDASPETLTIIDDVESCGGYIICVGKVAQRFKCFSDSVFGNGTSLCLSCEENHDEYYEDESEGKYGVRKATKKKFTYRQTKKTPHTKRYGKPSRPPPTRPYPTSEYNSICSFAL